MDTDFFFSVVFQSSDQKEKFLSEFCKKFGLAIEGIGGSQIQIVNGLKLASACGISLPQEKSLPYPYGDLALRGSVLDNEKF